MLGTLVCCERVSLVSVTPKTRDMCSVLWFAANACNSHAVAQQTGVPGSHQKLIYKVHTPSLFLLRVRLCARLYVGVWVPGSGREFAAMDLCMV